MKKVIKIFAIFLLTIMLNITVTASTENSKLQFTLEPQKSIGAYGNIKILDYETKAKSISTFDVSANGLLAIGLSSGDILIYDSNGTFKCNYSTNADAMYEVEWDDNFLMMYIIKSHKAIRLDMNNVNNIQYYDIIRDDSYEPKRRELLEREIEVNNVKYKGEYSNLSKWTVRLVGIDSNGNRTIFIDTTKELNKWRIRTLLFVVGLILYGVLMLLYTKKWNTYDVNKD